ncbi:restriction endonuclease subunit S [Undibacterium flavidum]|uniref:Restriction endonuclease subunit S n=1 Tax=Undibacterium flavidum TaxID=2762297 RepID=A0ABR6YAY7_9BURK|nr:restriction endonuclease subunit S [Undibacterium flavidum]MBC3873309.1 restriction endonuclease subunit S [Undibacterium flavidum]
MSAIHQLITDHLDIWTAADTEKKSGRGRASGNANSVYGIKKLRELILELAVRGKLVPQDPNDEPAFELLKRLNEDNLLLVNEGKIKKERPLPAITEDEKLFEIPSNWEWVRLDDIGSTFIGLTYSPKDITDVGIPVLRSSNIQNGKIDLTDLVRVSANIKSNLFVNHGDLLICARNGSKSLVGKTAMIKDLNEPMVFGAFMAIYKSRFNCYVEVFLNSPIFRKFLDGVATTTINQITQNNLKTTSIPIPPLEEQHRIVAKVDELMALCDQLEAQHNNAADAHEQLVSHLLSTLTQSQDAADFNANWQRIATHFDSLFTTESSIDALKQTLLQLAVMGKLVPQDPNDEPASELLKRIQAEKAKLVAEGTIKKDKPLAAIEENEKCFDLPKGWEWIRLGTLVEKSGAGWSPSCEAYPRIGTDWGVLKVSAVSWGKFLPDENKALPKSLEARLDCVVEEGDFLISRANTAELVAKSVVIDECPPNLMLSDKIVRLRLSSLCDKQFINLANASPFARAYYLLHAGGTSSSMKNVTREQILNLIFCCPPLEEQHRIVAKVDELMSICEQLKSRIIKAKQHQQKLADVLVENSLSMSKPLH